MKNVRPLDAYRFVYPENAIDLHEIAYFFQYEMDETVPVQELDAFNNLLDEWRAAWERKPRPVLIYQRAPDWIQIVDRRGPEPKAHAFPGMDAAIYEFCGETDRTVPVIAKHLAEVEGISAEQDQIRETLAKFCDLGLILEEDGRYLSLALPANPHW